MEKAWDTRVYGCKMFKVTKRLKAFKLKLRRLNLGKYNHLLTRVSQARKNLDLVQPALAQDQYNTQR